MQPESLKIKYVSCKKGNYHQGQQLNMVCVEQYCIFDPLCCCICTEQIHKGHKTITLRKFISETRKTSHQIKQVQGKNSNLKKFHKFEKMVESMIDNDRRSAIKEFKSNSSKIEQSLQEIENGFRQYYGDIEMRIKRQSTINPYNIISQSIQNIQSAKNASGMLPSIQRLLITMSSLQEVKSEQKNVSAIDQDSLTNLIEAYNNETVKKPLRKLQKLAERIQEISQKINLASELIDDKINCCLFKFSKNFKGQFIRVINDKTVEYQWGKENKYEVALMEPAMNFKQKELSFSFKIMKNSSLNWIAVGIANRKIVQNNNFQFIQSGKHGCYLISSNGGSWSNDTYDLNNRVRCYSFNQNDIITCHVDAKNKQLIFFKSRQIQLAKSQNELLQYYSPQLFQLAFDPELEGDFHPCVVFYFKEDRVEYLPNAQIDYIPKQSYQFSPQLQSGYLQILQPSVVKANYNLYDQYHSVLSVQSLQINNDDFSKIQPNKKFAFRIIRSQNQWIGIGMCHRKNAERDNFQFNYEFGDHGYYMISANGGSWSSTQSYMNNIVRTFKFSAGDVIHCEVIFGSKDNQQDNKIIFTKGKEVFHLRFKRIQGNPLHICAMFFFANDEVMLLPQIQ